MHTRNLLFFCVFAMSLADVVLAQTTVPLTVEEGVPLPLILTNKLPYKQNAPITARLVEPVFAFDREVIPSGTEVLGRITGFQAAPRWRRVMAILSGDLTPLREPRMSFDAIVLKSGTRIPIQTSVVPGSDTLVRFDRSAPQRRKGHVASAAATAREEIGVRKRAVIAAVKTPGKMERLKDMAWGFAPYHPQSVPSGSRFKATLLASLQFGTATLEASRMNEIGSEPPGEAVAFARLATDLNSGTTHHGEPVEAVLSRPLVSSGGALIFPEGSRLHGTVVQARAARRWHRNGQLAFMFTRIEPPSSIAWTAPAVQEVEGRLESVEVDSRDMSNVQLDEEGGVAITQSKRRFITPAVALMMASRAGDDGDRDRFAEGHARVAAYHSNFRNNFAGRMVGGGIGFGLVGTALGRISRPFGVALGFYGAGRSLYMNVIARGQEVHFPMDTPVEIRFGQR